MDVLLFCYWKACICFLDNCSISVISCQHLFFFFHIFSFVVIKIYTDVEKFWLKRKYFSSLQWHDRPFSLHVLIHFVSHTVLSSLAPFKHLRREIFNLFRKWILIYHTVARPFRRDRVFFQFLKPEAGVKKSAGVTYPATDKTGIFFFSESRSKFYLSQLFGNENTPGNVRRKVCYAG